MMSRFNQAFVDELAKHFEAETEYGMLGAVAEAEAIGMSQGTTDDVRWCNKHALDQTIKSLRLGSFDHFGEDEVAIVMQGYIMGFADAMIFSQTIHSSLEKKYNVNLPK